MADDDDDDDDDDLTVEAEVSNTATIKDFDWTRF
jgi:hypothetical protein